MNVVFFAASPMLRHVRPQASPLGPDREVVDYRDSSADPLDGHGNPRLVTGNTWSSPPANWPEIPFVGEAYAGYLDAREGRRRSWWPTPRPGSTPARGCRTANPFPACCPLDFDQFDPGTHPANLEILGHSPIPPKRRRANAASPFSDMTYYTDP